MTWAIYTLEASPNLHQTDQRRSQIRHAPWQENDSTCPVSVLLMVVTQNPSDSRLSSTSSSLFRWVIEGKKVSCNTTNNNNKEREKEVYAHRKEIVRRKDKHREETKLDSFNQQPFQKAYSPFYKQIRFLFNYQI